MGWSQPPSIRKNGEDATDVRSAMTDANAERPAIFHGIDCARAAMASAMMEIEPAKNIVLLRIRERGGIPLIPMHQNHAAHAAVRATATSTRVSQARPKNIPPISIIQMLFVLVQRSSESIVKSESAMPCGSSWTNGVMKLNMFDLRSIVNAKLKRKMHARVLLTAIPQARRTRCAMP